MKVLLASIAAVTVMSSCPPLFADSLPPEALDCFGKQAGNACTDLSTKQAGSCQNGACTSQKYDAGPIVYQCLTCSGPPPSDAGGCTIASGPTLKQVGPWLLAGTFSLLFLVGRRRRRGR
jgi:hypothetical protein